MGTGREHDSLPQGRLRITQDVILGPWGPNRAVPRELLSPANRWDSTLCCFAEPVTVDIPLELLLMYARLHRSSMGQAMISPRRLFRRGHRDAVLQQEIALHLAEEIAENIERGMPADEARRQAYLKFGSPRRVREELWQQNSFAIVDTFWRDMRQVLRRLGRSPSVVLTVMISLGLGIAANVFIFSAVNKLLLQEPPVGHPTTLLNIYSTSDHGQRTGPSSLTTFNDLREQAKPFSGVAAYNNFLPATIAGPGEPERVWGQSATGNFFDVAELPMTLGRGFHSGEDRSPVIVLSYGLWRRHFSGGHRNLGKARLPFGEDIHRDRRYHARISRDPPALQYRVLGTAG